MQEKLKLTREKLIIFALLLGSDYTGGVKGVGLVNAMEIIKVFTSFEKLEQFKKWAKLPDVLLPEEEKTAELLRNASKDEIEFYELHRKFKNYWYVDD
jgi:DNA excision repair protein ERCC-5